MADLTSTQAATRAIISGVKYFAKPKVAAVFVLMVAFLFLIGYIGIYSVLNLAVQNPLTSTYTIQYPTYVVVTALALVLLGFVSFFYFLSVELEAKKRYELNAPRGGKSILGSALRKYPKFLISTVFQLFLFIGGFALFIVPGIYFGVKSMFFNIEIHNGDTTLSSGLRDSFETSKAGFSKGLLVLLFYLVVFVVLIAVLSASNLGAFYLYLGTTILFSFCITGYTFSSDSLYHLLKGRDERRINSALFRRVLSNR